MHKERLWSKYVSINKALLALLCAQQSCCHAVVRLCVEPVSSDTVIWIHSLRKDTRPAFLHAIFLACQNFVFYIIITFVGCSTCVVLCPSFNLGFSEIALWIQAKLYGNLSNTISPDYFLIKKNSFFMIFFFIFVKLRPSVGLHFEALPPHKCFHTDDEFLSLTSSEILPITFFKFLTFWILTLFCFSLYCTIYRKKSKHIPHSPNKSQPNRFKFLLEFTRIP